MPPTDVDWEEWFDKQYDLNERIDKAIAGLTVGKGDGFKLALWSSVIEHAAETLRIYIPEEVKNHGQVHEPRVGSDGVSGRPSAGDGEDEQAPQRDPG